MKYFTCNKIKMSRHLAIATILTLGSSFAAHAAPLSVFTGWTMIASEDNASGAVGGQAFDAEYLFYQQDGRNISIGLQSGFDLVNGHQVWNEHDYYAGDLALSFDGNTANGYEYAFDFGLLTKGYYQYDNPPNSDLDTMNIVASGIYEVTTWSTQVNIEEGTSPFAMLNGTPVNNTNAPAPNNTIAGELSGIYWRTVTFNLDDLFDFNPSLYDADRGIDISWTMSCGNDYINGNINNPVPEPATLVLFGTGLAGLVGFRRRKQSK